MHVLLPQTWYSEHFANIGPPIILFQLHCNTALKSIDHKWNEFGLAVGSTVRMLEKFKYKDHPFSLVIDNWWRGNIEGGKLVTWKSVVEALNDIEEGGLAETIANEHCNQSTCN